MTDALISVGIPLATLAVGLGAGYWTRTWEFRRDHRLRIYSECIASFQVAARVGAGALSVHVQLGESLFAADHNEHRNRIWDEWDPAWKAFEMAIVQMRLVASPGVRIASESLEQFLRDNVLAVPPFTRTLDTAQWGSAAKIGPAEVERAAIALARQVGDRAAGDVVRDRRRKL